MTPVQTKNLLNYYWPQFSDWNYLRAMTEVDRNNSECLEKLRERVKYSEKLDELIYNYTNITIESADVGDVICQVWKC